MRWTLLIPAKALPRAKSRLATGDGADHARLVRAIRADTIAAAQAAGPVARIVIVVDELDAPAIEAPARYTIVQRRPGLNAALREAEQFAATRWPGDGIAALLGDLPALRSHDLAEVLDAAARHRRAFVADAAGLGTTLLTAIPGVELRPAFGSGSAARHALIGVALEAGASLRRDVDTAADLSVATGLGLGPATRAVVESRGVHLDPA